MADLVVTVVLKGIDDELVERIQKRADRGPICFVGQQAVAVGELCTPMIRIVVRPPEAESFAG